jgi:alpha-L-fucosidase
MAWPADHQIAIRSLAPSFSKTAEIDSVRLIGYKEQLTHEQTEDGLLVRLPSTRPCEHAWALRIEGRNLRDFDSDELSGVAAERLDSKGP